MEAKFKVGQVVLYQNGTTFELGVVKSVVAHTKRHAQRQDGLHGEPTGSEYIAYSYFVLYHTGDTSASTPEHTLHEIKNAYAFLILRRKADTSSIDETPARALANKILNELNDMVMGVYDQPLFDNYSPEETYYGDNDGDTPTIKGLIGGMYYECEDQVTELINEWEEE
jgi:hypothetical protein